MSDIGFAFCYSQQRISCGNTLYECLEFWLHHSFFRQSLVTITWRHEVITTGYFAFRSVRPGEKRRRHYIRLGKLFFVFWYSFSRTLGGLYWYRYWLRSSPAVGTLFIYGCAPGFCRLNRRSINSLTKLSQRTENLIIV